MEARTITVTKSAYRDQRLSFSSCGGDFFPEEAFGSPEGNGSSGKPITMHLRGLGASVESDFPTSTAGKPRWFLRNRKWVRPFLEHHSLTEGDELNIVRVGADEYILDPVPKHLTFIDLFAGIGGTRLAFEGAGATCIFSSEWDRFAQQTYSANHGDIPAGDITQVNAVDIPDHDILVAGFPCQPFSIAGVSKKNALGKAHGFADEIQGTLFFDIVRILQEKQPRAFLLENVRNLRSHDKGRTYALIRAALAELGYVVHDKIIDAIHTVPQHRERIFMVGMKPALFFSFPSKEEFERYRTARVVGDILDTDVHPKYTLTDHLWTYLQGYAEKHRKAGNGFGFGLVDRSDTTRTLSARYYKDGSEILLRQRKKNPRRLTPRECARLMGFPDSFGIPVSDTQAYKQFGNSVVVPVVRAIADRLTSCLLGNTLDPAPSSSLLTAL